MSNRFRRIETLIRSIYGDGSVQLHEPVLDHLDAESVSAVIRTGYVSSVGKEITAFENALKLELQCKHIIAVSSGTSALHLALEIFQFSADDIVIVSPLTFVASAAAIRYTGAIPKFIDINSCDLSLSLEKIDEYLTTECLHIDGRYMDKTINKKVSGVLITHPFGLCGAITSAAKFCKDRNLILIEDAAAVLGNKYAGKPLGTFGDASIISFNGNKTITTGGGGALIVRNIEKAKLARHLATTAKVKHSYRYIHDKVGYNYRMPNLNAALGLSQLKKLNKILEEKLSTHMAYSELFAELDGVKLMVRPDQFTGTPWLNTVCFESERDGLGFIEYMHSKGIMVRMCWDPIHKLKPYAKFSNNSLLNVENMKSKLINLPSGPANNA